MLPLKRLGILLCKRQFSVSNILSSPRYPTDLYEPDYLPSLRPDTPVYESLNVQITGHNYPILESFQGQINKIADILEIDVEDNWAVTPQKHQIHQFKPFSTVVDSEYNLMLYERNVQMADVPSLKYPLFLRMVHECTPEGVTVTVRESLPEYQEIRYIPDNQLLALKQELEEIGIAKKKKKKK